MIDLWSYDVVANRWRALAPAGKPPAAASAGDWGTLAYDPSTARFYFLNDSCARFSF